MQKAAIYVIWSRFIFIKSCFICKNSASESIPCSFNFASFDNSSAKDNEDGCCCGPMDFVAVRFLMKLLIYSTIFLALSFGIASISSWQPYALSFIVEEK